MFIAHLKSGKSIVEGKDVQTWDEVPDAGIAALEITLPFRMQRLQNGEMKQLPSPTIKIGKYDYYYCAYQAVSKIATMSGQEMGFSEAGIGTITHQIIAGVDEKRQEVCYFEVNQFNSDIVFRKFDREELKVSLQSLKKGV